MKKFANQSAGWWLFLGICWTVIFFIRLYEMEWYKSDAIWIVAAIAALFFYGVALAIVIVRKIQYARKKREENQTEV